MRSSSVMKVWLRLDERGSLDRSFSCFCPAPSLCGRDLLTRFDAQYALALHLRRCRTIDGARAPAGTIGPALQQSLSLVQPRDFTLEFSHTPFHLHTFFSRP